MTKEEVAKAALAFKLDRTPENRQALKEALSAFKKIAKKKEARLLLGHATLIRECLNCGREFVVDTQQGKHRLYCGRPCGEMYRRNHPFTAAMIEAA